MDIDTTSIIEIMKSDKFEPMNPADQAAGIALAFGKRAIETGVSSSLTLPASQPTE